MINKVQGKFLLFSIKLMILVSGVCFNPLIASGQSDDRPNILWITIEDTSPHFIGCYGNKNAKTPNIDRLAEAGVRFTNAFANAPVCSSARSTIITGALNETLGTGNHRSNYPLPDFIKGFPTFLKESGWYTSNNVKTDYSTSDSKRLVRESWNESSKKAGWWSRKEGQPFFSVFNFTDSHQSRTMTNPYKWYQKFVYDELDDELVIGENEFEMPPHFRDSPQMRKSFARVYNSLSLTDKKIGMLLDSLKQDGLVDETIIFLYADHGEAIPGGKSGSVGIGYKVPFIIWFSEKYKHLSPWGTGTVSDELINFDDLGPTVLSIAGIKAPDYMTGRPILGDFKESSKPYIFTSRNRIDETPGLTRSITDGKFMYSRVFMPQFPEQRYQKYADVSDLVQQMRKDNKQGLLNDLQKEMFEPRATNEYFYDLEADPWKLNNLALDKPYQKKINSFRKELFNHILEVRDVLFLPEYSVDQLAGSTTPFEYRTSKEYNLPEILKTAALNGEDNTVKPLIAALKATDEVVLYWALMGLQRSAGVDWEGLKGKITALIDHDYPPVKVTASMIAFERFDDKKAETKLQSFIASDNPHIALQALQLIQYTEGADIHFQDDLLKIVEERKDEKPFLSAVSAAETMLFYSNGRDLYYDKMREWEVEKNQ